MLREWNHGNGFVRTPVCNCFSDGRKEILSQLLRRKLKSQTGESSIVPALRYLQLFRHPNRLYLMLDGAFVQGYYIFKLNDSTVPFVVRQIEASVILVDASQRIIF